MKNEQPQFSHRLSSWIAVLLLFAMTVHTTSQTIGLLLSGSSKVLVLENETGEKEEVIDYEKEEITLDALSLMEVDSCIDHYVLILVPPKLFPSQIALEVSMPPPDLFS